MSLRVAVATNDVHKALSDSAHVLRPARPAPWGNSRKSP
jgi:hypothetical protein